MRGPGAKSIALMLAGTAVLTGILTPSSGDAQTTADRILSEKLIGPFTYSGPRDPRLRRTIFAAPKGGTIAFAALEGKRPRVYMDGTEPRLFDGLELKNYFAPNARRAVKVWRGPVYSADGKHYAFPARLGSRWFMILDGKAQGRYRFVREARLSSDGKHLAYIARGGRGEFVVHDGKTGPAYRRIETLLLSPDGRHTAYTALKRRNVRVMVVNGREDTPRVNPRKAVFSPPGNSLAYTAGAKGRESIIRARLVNGVPQFGVGRTHESVGRLIFSPNGKRSAYLAMDDGKRRFIIDGRETPVYQFSYHFTFSPDSSKYAYVAAGGDGMFIVLNGRAGTAFKHVIMPLDKRGRPRFFTPTGRWAYKAGEDDQEFVVTDRGREKPFDTVNPSPWGPPYIIPGSEEVAFSARFDERAFIVAGTQQSKKYAQVQGPVPAGEQGRMAFAARRDGRVYLVRNDKELSNYTMIHHIAFGPDKQRVMALVSRDGKYLVDVDGRPGRTYDAVIGTPRFTGANSVAYYGVRDGNVYAVRETINYPSPADPRPAPKTPGADKTAPPEKKPGS